MGSWAEALQEYQHDRREKVHPDLCKGRTVGYVRGENSKRERSYNPLLGRFLDEQREREQQDFEDKVKRNYMNLARDVQLRKEAPFDLITHERKFAALVSESEDPARLKEPKCPCPDTAADYNIISNLRFDEHHWAHPEKRPRPRDRVPKQRKVPAMLLKDFNILTNRYLEHHEEKLERDQELNLLEAAEKMRQTCPFNPLSQTFCDPRLEENMRACQDALATEVRLRGEEAQPVSYRGNITGCYDMLSHKVKDKELLKFITSAEGARKARFKTRFKFEDTVRRADAEQEDRVKRMKPLQVAHDRFVIAMDRGYDILTNEDFGRKRPTPRSKPLLTPWEKVLEGREAAKVPTSARGAGETVSQLNFQTLRLPDEAPSVRSARSTLSSQRAPVAPAIPGSPVGSVFSKAKEVQNSRAQSDAAS